MKQEKNTLENKSVVCSACVGGTATTTYRTTPNGPITSIQHMCEVCQGQGSVLVKAWRYCQIGACTGLAVNRCNGPICDDAWVCKEHWMEDNLGFSNSGYACETCVDEVGAGGH